MTKFRIHREETSKLTRRSESGRRPARFVVFLLVALCGLAPNSPAAIPSPEKLLPEDTLVVATIPDFTRMREIYKTFPETRLWNDPAMKPFREKFLSKLKEKFVQPLQRELGIKLDEFIGLPQGQLTFAMTQNGWPQKGSQAPGLLVLMDARDKSPQLKKTLADLRKKWVDAGKSLRTEKIRNVEFSVLPLASNEMPKTLQKFFPSAAGNSQADGDGAGSKKGAKNELVVGQYESLLIAGNSTRVVDQVMVHLSGGAAPALGDLAAYDADRLALFRDAPFYGWVNTKALLDLLKRRPDQDGNQTPDPLAILDPSRIIAAIGFSGLKTLAFNFRNSSEGSSFELFLGVPAAGRQGIFKLFPSEPKSSGPPPFVPADVVRFHRWRINGSKAWEALQQIISNISPQWLGSLNFLLDTANAAARQEDPDFDIRKNLFGNLGDDFISYEKAPRGASPAELRSPPSLFLIGSPHADELAASLKNLLILASQSAGKPTEREFLGRKIYSVPLPPLPFPTGAVGTPPRKRTLSYAASGGYMAITTDTSMLEDFLRSGDSQQKSLRETQGFVQAAARVGGTGTGWFGYENEAAATRLAFESLRTNAVAKKPAPVMPPGFTPFQGPTSAFKDWLDYSLLPPFAQVSKYFYFMVYAGSENMKGLTFKWYSPMPPQLRK